jgi:hypothetical protein
MCSTFNTGHTTFELGKTIQKTCVLPAVCSPKATLNTLKVYINLEDILFFEIFSSLPFSRYAKIANRTTYTSITQHSYTLWPYPKQ